MSAREKKLRLGTRGSQLARWQAQWVAGELRRRGHSVELVEIATRGDVETRLRKLDEGQFDALILAEAGLRRLGLADRVTQVLPFDVMLPAVGQGALGIECRAADMATLAILRELEDDATRAAVTAERALLEQLRG